jgi:hypothetical protein
VGGHGWKPAERGEACARWWRCSGVLLLPSLQWRRRRRWRWRWQRQWRQQQQAGAAAVTAVAGALAAVAPAVAGGVVCVLHWRLWLHKMSLSPCKKRGCARLLTISHRWPRGRPGNAGAQICLVHRYNRSLLRTTAEFRRHWFTVARASSLEPIARPPRAQYPAAIHGAAPISASFCRGAKLASAS